MSRNECKNVKLEMKDMRHHPEIMNKYQSVKTGHIQENANLSCLYPLSASNRKKKSLERQILFLQRILIKTAGEIIRCYSSVLLVEKGTRKVDHGPQNH